MENSLTLRFDELEMLLKEMETLQTKKVLDLARRLKPGLVLEDLQNPHDFPELHDTDWHYEDGVLTGIKSVQIAVGRLLRDRQRQPEEASSPTAEQGGADGQEK
ncbi:hypothetical protein [Pendulispora albinea]|uniref:Uncharacterized protein n=1 Tax=Pendulispora albinea TaxID=2741071 RepID=A0ABZ2LSG2_9BACT